MFKSAQFKFLKVLFFALFMCSSTSVAMILRCPVCFEEDNVSGLFRFSCGHECCINCISEIIRHGIQDRENPKCPIIECRQDLTQQDFDFLVVEDRIRQKLEYLGIAKNPNSKLCPTHNCLYAFINEDVEIRIIQCPECHQEYCCQCLRMHAPKISCKKAQSLAEMQEDERFKDQERASEEWISKNSRHCPKCSTPLFKKGGCNKVVCPKCKTKVKWNSEKRPS